MHEHITVGIEANISSSIMPIPINEFCILQYFSILLIGYGFHMSNNLKNKNVNKYIYHLYEKICTVMALFRKTAQTSSITI